MAQNIVLDDAMEIALPVPNGTPSGTPLRLGAAATGLNVVTQTKTGAAGEPDGGNVTGEASCKLNGAAMVPVSTTTTLAKLDPVYITSGNVLTPSSSGNQLFGHALTAKPATAGALVLVRIAN